MGYKHKELVNYDSDTVHKEPRQVIGSLLNVDSQFKVTMKPFYKQVGGLDCGVSAIAAVAAMVFKINPSVQQGMQPRLL